MRNENALLTTTFSENSVNETYDPFSDPTNTTLEELIDQVVFPESTTKEYSPSTASRLYPSPPPPPVPTVEVAQKPPPAYENFAQKSRGRFIQGYSDN